ncbi:hypothetical protein BCR36DRAFT_407122 [Piromyces finnis]|uniref:Coth-domain-containing protein n=1 Tax=Piromyces finnis TaxID=1754191 RepID=A0A1Y1UY63_9FUNG|nr:hypothetical protein BCR36DRAFT_407122 [Piromyces finnis]|eukprot:ORX42202.1 hypothetical protein BCR36DRAFT_407122 [Piromyces finnis]
MKIKNLPLLSFLPGVLSNVSFRIIAPKGKPSVIIGSTVYPMGLHEFPVYEVSIDIDLPVRYFYSIDYSDTNEADKGVVQEEFDRVKESGEETLNEFFNRKITVKTHPNLPKAYDKYPNFSPSKLFDDTSISTVIINGDPKAIKALHKDPTSDEKIHNIEFIYATPYSVRSFKNATLSIAGQTTKYASKLSYKISNLKNDKNKELYKRTSIKLRAEHMDPTYLRDKIYSDILNSLGVPCAQNKFTRVYINGDPIGLFDLSDNVANNRYLRETLNNGKKFANENIMFKADYYPPVAWGDLGYYGNDPYSKKYDIYYYKGGDIDDLDEDQAYDKNINMIKQYLIPFLKEINEYPKSGSLNLDIEMFLKYMAMEFVSGAVDNYWNRPGNYYIMKNMNSNDGKWLFLDSDFHFSFGIGGSKLSKYLSSSINTYTSVYDEDDIGTSRPILDNIRKNPDNEKTFKDIFIRLINTAFHVDALFPRIDSLAELIRDDVAWDLTLPRVSGYSDAEDLQYTINDFEKQINRDDTECDKKYIISLKCWIRHKGINIASQFGIEYPDSPDYSKGVVETLVQSNELKESNESSSISDSHQNTDNKEITSDGITFRNYRNIALINITIMIIIKLLI